MSHPLNIVRREWTIRDRLLARLFPRRTVNFGKVSKADELMQKRFGGLFICGVCAVRYRDGIRRWGYARHPDMSVKGNACDFCETVYGWLPIWSPEERQYPTRQQHADESARAGIRSAPHAYDGRRRVIACTR